MKKELIRYFAITLVVILVGFFIYPTMYRYDKFDQKIPVRINRVTGKTEFLSLSGWQLAAATPTPTPAQISKLVVSTPSPSPSPELTYKGETFNQYYERASNNLNPGQSKPTRGAMFIEWEQARLGLSDRLVDPIDYFTVGSTKDEVRKVMGVPTSISVYSTGDDWYYDTSVINFDKNDKVKSYHNFGDRLKVR